MVFLFCATLIMSCKPYKGPSIFLPNRVIDFGKISISKDYNFKIFFTNFGDKPLIIKNVIGDCGCVNLKWPSHSIKVNTLDSIIGKIKISDTIIFKKTVMIYTNTDSIFYRVDITGKGTN